MPAARAFVIYATPGDKRGAAVARQLIHDLRSHGASVVTADETLTDESLVVYLTQNLPRCQYLILVQTPLASKSSRVLTTVSMALKLAARQRMRGVLRFIAAPGDEQSLWETLHFFDATWDYPRARTRILLELGLLTLDDEVPTFRDRLTPASPFSVAGSLAPDPPSTPMPRSTARLDRPQPVRLRHHISHWWMNNSPRLRRVMVSLALVLVMILASGAVALLASRPGPTNTPLSTSPAPLRGGPAPIATPSSTSPSSDRSAPTATPSSTSPSPSTSGTLTTGNGTPAPTVGNGTDPASLRTDCHTDIIARADTAHPPYPNRPYSYPVGSPWLLYVGNATLTGQFYYCPQENSIFGVFAVTGTSITGSCSLLANYGTISVSRNIPTIYNKTSPWIYGICHSFQYAYRISPDNSASRQQQTLLGETYAGDTWQLCWTTQSQHTYCSQPTATPAA